MTPPSFTLSDSLFGTPYRSTIYDQANKLVADCGYPYILGCSVDVRIPFLTSMTYTAYVSANAPTTGPPSTIRASTTLTVRHTGWPGRITSFSATPEQADYGTSRLKLSVSDSITGTPYRFSIYDHNNRLVASCSYPYSTGCATDVNVAGSANWYRGYVATDAPTVGPPTQIVASAGPVVVSQIKSASIGTAPIVAQVAARLASRYGEQACLVLGEKIRTFAMRSSVPDTTLLCNTYGIQRAVQFIANTASGLEALHSLIDADEGPTPPRYDPDCDEVGATGCLDGEIPDGETPEPAPAGSGGILPPPPCVTGSDRQDIIDASPENDHHLATNKNDSTWTPLFKQITDKYGLDLNDSWNIVRIKHRGPHPIEYHQWVRDNMVRADEYANGDPVKFKEFYETNVKNVVENDPLIVRLAYWKCRRN